MSPNTTSIPLVQQPVRQSMPAPVWFVIALALFSLTATLFVSIDMEVRFGKDQEKVIAAITTLEGNVTSLQNTVEEQGQTINALEADKEKQGEAIELLQKRAARLEEHSKAQKSSSKINSRRLKALEAFARRKACKGSRSTSCKR